MPEMWGEGDCHCIDMFSISETVTVFDHRRIDHSYLRICMYFNVHIDYEPKNDRNSDCFDVDIENSLLSLLAILMKQSIRRVEQRKDKLDNRFKLKTERMENDLVVVNVDAITLVEQMCINCR